MDCLLTAKLQRATRARAGPSHVGVTMRGVATSFATSFAKQLWSEVKTHGPTAVKLGCLVNVIHSYGMEVTMCLGPSMLPTFNHRGDVVLMERVSVFANGVNRGDVVISKSPNNPKHTVCKRVLGKEGDHIQVPKAGNFGGELVVKVPKGHVWLQGDNANNSTDSRDYGPVPYALLKGKVFLKVWPPREAGWVRNESWRHVPVGEGN